MDSDKTTSKDPTTDNSQTSNPNEQTETNNEPSTPSASEQAPSFEITVPLCQNVFFDESKSCDWIHPNSLPLNELGREVPKFTTSQQALDWGEDQMYDESSKWYMCGFTRMNGFYNNGTEFFFAYMKSCPQ